MIARTWKGVTLESDSKQYLNYLERTGLKDYRKTKGYKGVYVFQRNEKGKTEFLLISLWDSYDSIRNFAGGDIEKAVYYPEDEKFLLELQPNVVHYEVKYESLSDK